MSDDGLSRLAADLERAAYTVARQVPGVVTKGAVKIKQDAARRISGHPHSPHYPQAIDFDVRSSGVLLGDGWVEAEIGPDKRRRQGALGNILEYGTSRNAPIPHLAPALRAEEGPFTAALGDLAGDIL